MQTCIYSRFVTSFLFLAASLFLSMPFAAAQPAPGLWAWGSNRYGQIGDGTNTDTYTPIPTVGLSGVEAIAAGNYHSVALKSDGTVWAWGRNYYGQLGNGTEFDQSLPVQVVRLSGIQAIAAGEEHNLALRSDGTVWAWGLNGEGQLGDGTVTTDFPGGKTSPVQVVGLSGVQAIAAGPSHGLALKSDGTVWAWGNNMEGQLGNGRNTLRNTIPAQVIGLSGVQVIAAGGHHNLALKSDGTVWAWGGNTYGQLGDGTSNMGFPSSRNTPVQVIGLSGVQAIAAGTLHSVALKSDGTVWAWGHNDDGQLGDGTYSDKNTPVPVIGMSRVQAIEAGRHHNLALKSNGTVWAWGSNSYGQIGNGTVGPGFSGGENIPVAAEDLTGVIRISAGGSLSLALVGEAVRYDTAPTVTGGAGIIGQTITLRARLQQANNAASLAGKWLTVRADGIPIGSALTDSSGMISFDYKLTGAPGAGGYLLTATFPGDSQYIASRSYPALLIIRRASTFLSVNNFTGRVGQTAQLLATLRRSADKAFLSGQRALFSLDGVAVGTAVTEADGVARLTYLIPESLGAGTHEIKAEFFGDTSYDASLRTNTLTVNKTDVSLTVPNYAGRGGQNTLLCAVLRRTADNALLVGKAIEFLINGAAIGTANTGSNGTACLPYSIPESLGAGMHTLRVRFAGDTAHNALSLDRTLTILTRDTVLAVNKNASPRGTTAAFRATLRRGGDGSFLLGKRVRFELDGVFIGEATTEANGVAKLFYLLPSGLSVGSHAITARFAGDSSYNTSSGTATLTVKP